MKKALLLIPVLLITACGSAGGGGDNKEEGKTNPDFINQTVFDAPYKVEVSDGGKARIVNRANVPVLMQSSLLRTDLLKHAYFMKAEEMEDYFALAKETNLNFLDITIMWSEIETEKDVYSFNDLDCYLNFAKKYDLKLNIEWYGSFVDGETHDANMPKYINDDKETYPLILDLFDFACYGRSKIMDWNNKNLIEREQLALYSMMNHIYDWNHSNDLYDPVATVQIGQGIDRFQRWRVTQYKVYDKEGNLMSFDDAWQLSYHYLDEIGKAVKYSKYKTLTRAEFCEQNAVVNYVRKAAELDNIDIVCPTYLHEISNMKNGIKNFVDELEDMPVLNVENWANDINYKQTLIEYAMGGSGYVCYQLSAPRYFPESPNGTLYNRYNAEGATLVEKFTSHGDRAVDAKRINGIISKAFVAIANAPMSNFTTFGLNASLDNKTGDERIQKVYLKRGVLLDFSNPTDCLGFALYDQNYVYCSSDKDATLTLNNCAISIGQKGRFNAAGEWESEGTIVLENNKTLTMAANEVYRVRLVTVDPLPSASQLNADGYKSGFDSIRS